MGCIGSCLGSCAATCCCSAASKCCGSFQKGSLIPYVILSFLATVVAIVLRYWGGPMVLHMYIYNPELCNTDKCVGFGAVYRISFALCLFYLIHALLMHAISSCARLDRSSWFLKIFLFIGLLVVAWMIPNVFYDGYVHVARVVAAIFLILQIIILIDLAYNWNETWRDQGRTYEIGIVVISIIFFIASLIILIFSYIWFTRNGSCDIEKFFISFTLCATLIATGISVSNIAGQYNKGGILPASIVTLYCYWLLYSALQDDPHSCNSLESNDTLQLIIGLIIGAASISYAGWNLATTNTLFGADPEVKAAQERDNVQHEKKTEDVEAARGRGDDAPPEEEIDEETAAVLARRNVKFHYVMACAAMYMAMLLTNWGSRQQVEVGINNSPTAYDQTLENMWIRMATQWLTLILFIWTLIAPAVCTGRDFS